MPSTWDEMTVDEKLEWLKRRITTLQTEIANDFGTLRRRIEALEKIVPAPTLSQRKPDYART
jgi:hypothetical protein